MALRLAFAFLMLFTAGAFAVTDSFAWLEDVHGKKPLEWVAAQNKTALGTLKADPRYDANYKSILSVLDARPRHGYDLAKLIRTRSGGQLSFHIDSLYPLLYRLEERGWIKGTWVKKSGERRRRFYKVTAEGRRVLAQQKKTWAAFVDAVRRVTGVERA